MVNFSCCGISEVSGTNGAERVQYHQCSLHMRLELLHLNHIYHLQGVHNREDCLCILSALHSSFLDSTTDMVTDCVQITSGGY